MEEPARRANLEKNRVTEVYKTGTVKKNDKRHSAQRERSNKDQHMWNYKVKYGD